MTDKKTTAKKKESIHQALFRFHSLFHGAQKTGENEFFKKKGKASPHFTLDDITYAITPILQECGLYVIHWIEGGHQWTGIFDKEGDCRSSSIRIPESDNPQATGSCSTYFKRYNLTGLLNISEADDDANYATLGVSKPPTKEKLEKARQARPKQALATKEQLAGLREYMNKYDLDVRYVTAMEKDWDKLSIEDVGKELLKLSAAENAGTLKEKGNE